MIFSILNIFVKEKLEFSIKKKKICNNKDLINCTLKYDVL